MAEAKFLTADGLSQGQGQAAEKAGQENGQEGDEESFREKLPDQRAARALPAFSSVRLPGRGWRSGRWPG